MVLATPNKSTTKIWYDMVFFWSGPWLSPLSANRLKRSHGHTVQLNLSLTQKSRTVSKSHIDKRILEIINFIGMTFGHKKATMSIGTMVNDMKPIGRPKFTLAISKVELRVSVDQCHILRSFFHVYWRKAPTFYGRYWRSHFARLHEHLKLVFFADTWLMINDLL